MKTIELNDDALGNWDYHTDLSLYYKVELIFRNPRILLHDKNVPVNTAIGLITKPKSRVRIIDRGAAGAEHLIVVGSWEFREKNAQWSNPEGEVDIIPHSEIESMTFQDNFGTPILKLVNKFHTS